MAALAIVGVVISVWITNLNAAASIDCPSHDIQCYLDTIVISVPDSCFLVEETNRVACVKNLICDGFTFGGLNSSYLLQEPTTLGVGVVGLGADCAGNWTYGVAGGGSIIADIENITAVADIYIKKQGLLPVLANFSYCDVPTMDVFLKFTGGPISDILERISDTIETGLINAVDMLVCNKTASLFASNATNAFVTIIDPALVDVTSSEPTEIPPETDSQEIDFINWPTSIFGLLHGITGGNAIGEMFNGADTNVCIANSSVGPTIKNYTLNTLFDMLTNGTGVILLDEEISLGDSLTVTGIEIGGLTSFNDVAFLAPTDQSNLTLWSSMELSSLSLALNISMNVNDTYVENLSIRMSLSDLSLGIELLLGVNRTKIGMLFLDQFTNIDCLLTTVHYLNITSLLVNTTVDLIEVVQYDGLSYGTDAVDLLNNAMLLLTNGFGDTVTSVIRGLAQGLIRTGLNNKFQSVLLSSSASCPRHIDETDSTAEDLIVWTNSSLIGLIDKVIDDVIGVSGVNELLFCLTNGTGEVDLFPSLAEKLFGYGYEISIKGLNSFFNFSLLHPAAFSPYGLTSAIGLGSCNHDLCIPLEISITGGARAMNTLMDSLFSDNVNLVTPFSSSLLNVFLVETDERTSVTISMENLYMLIDTLVKADAHDVANLHLSQIGTTGCVESTFTSLAIESVEAGLSSAFVVGSGGMVDKNVSDAASMILDFFTNPSKVSDRNDQISSSVQDSTAICSNGGVMPNVVPDEDKEAVISKTWEVVLLVAGCCVCVLITMRLWYGKLLYTSDEKYNLLVPDDRSMWERYEFKDALMFHSDLSAQLRYGILVSGAGVIVVFIMANIAPDSAAVYPVFTVRGVESIPDFEFLIGLGDILKYLWDAKVYQLAVLIFIFSVCFPYLKLISILFCWVVPPAVVSVPLRESILIWLDILGKFSLIDYYVMVLLMIAFNVTVHLSPEFSVALYMQPRWGMFAGLLGTIACMVLGHIALGAHRLVTQPEIDVHMEERPVESMMNHVYAAPNAPTDYQTLQNPDSKNSTDKAVSGSRWVAVTFFGKTFGCIFLVGTLFCIVYGGLMNTFSFDWRGLLGLIMSKRDENIYEYGAVSIGEVIPRASGEPELFSNIFLQIIFYIYVFAIPLALISMFLYVWVTPMTLYGLRQTFTLVEVLNAWSALDVFVVSVFSGLLELDMFVAYMIGDLCDGIDKILVEKFDSVLHGDDVCVDVVGVVLPHMWVLTLAAVAMFIASTAILVSGHQSLEERMASESCAAQGRRSLAVRSSSGDIRGCSEKIVGRVSSKKDPGELEHGSLTEDLLPRQSNAMSPGELEHGSLTEDLLPRQSNAMSSLHTEGAFDESISIEVGHTHWFFRWVADVLTVLTVRIIDCLVYANILEYRVSPA